MGQVVCVPVTAQGDVDPRWGRAARVAVAHLANGRVERWQEIDVAWDRDHDAQGEGRHHAAVARFLLDQGVEVVVAHHMGEPMRHMLERMGVGVRLGAAGPARAAAAALAGAAAAGTP